MTEQTPNTTPLLKGLNVPQRAAVAAGSGPVLVLAGPGSGKTRVLTHRIAYLIQEMGVAPWQIMAVTFTNKAAREMRHRIETILGENLRGLTMGTFHATCARFLRREAQHLDNYTAEFVIFDSDDQRQVVRQALNELNLDDKKFPPNKMLSGISAAKSELITPEIYAATNYIGQVTKRVYERYQQLLHSNNAMDFDDLLTNAVLLFEQNEAILQKYQQQYHHILVDEFQDTNTAQYGLLKRLAAVHRNIFAVGDSDQSIYKWRGADFRNIQRFQEVYPEAQIILLEQNYRSTQIILDAAKAIIRRNTDRVHKELFTDRQGGALIELRETYDQSEEADTVVAIIKDLMLQGFSGGDCAVMYRTNAQSRALEEAFLRVGMPYRLVGATRFYNRREIKDLIAYLRLIHNPSDAISFNRVINTPTRGIGSKTQEQLRGWAIRHGRQPAEAVIELVSNPDVQHPFNGRAYNALSHFGGMLDAWLKLRDQVSIAELLDLILDQADYRSYINDGTPEGEDRWENVMEFRGVASLAEDLSLSEFLEQVALVSEVDNLEEDTDAPTLLTLHAAKGLEFPIVILTGLEEGILPHSRSLAEPDELAEERRLFYVGLTRAEDRLYLLYASRRSFYGQMETAVPSRFLEDLPNQLLQGGRVNNVRVRREQTKQRVSSWRWSADTISDSSSSGSRSTRPSGAKRSAPRYREQPSSQPPIPAVNGPQFRTGQRVAHAKFGAGIVIESKPTGNDEEVVVAFADVGIKKLAASLANLEIKE